MRKRSVLIFLLLVAFLLSAWGNMIAAAFCPRYMSLNSCIKHQSRQTKQVEHKSCHHEMADMEMDDMKMDDMQMENDSASKADVESVAAAEPTLVVAESSIEQAAFDLPIEPCGHCWMHSQPSSGSGTLAAVNPSPRPVEALAPPSDITIDLGFPNPTAIEPLEHSPPGNSFPRHILINVFRI